MKHLVKYNIITDRQHGFRRRHSCETQLIATVTIEGIASKLRAGKDQVDIILLDFAKSFTSRTIMVFAEEPFPGSRNSWVADLNRLEGQKSTKKEVLSGVPQGNVFGSLLFLAFIIYLLDVVRISDARLFADDCLLYRHIRNDKDSVDLQTDLSALEDWETKWQTRFHPEKCTVIRVWKKTSASGETSHTNYVAMSWGQLFKASLA